MNGVAIGIDVGGTKALALALGPEGEVLASSQAPSRASSLDELVDALALQVQGVAAHSGLDVATTPIGLGLAGMVSRDGLFAFSPHLPGASGANVGERLASALSIDAVALDNDANLAALAEGQWGAARNEANYVMVTLGTGIGGGIVVDGQLLRGANGFAGEIGHMTLVARGEPCPCGGRGCWERYASGSALARLARDAAREGRLAVADFSKDPTGEEVAAAADRGDDGARALLEEMGWWFAAGLANLAAILDTSCFVVGGGLSALSTHLLPSTRRRLVELTEGGAARPALRVIDAALGPRAGAMGAALAARMAS
ncbi:MAG TPA: ROK family protein [Acidimicrobiales bacterium]|nr:ROK family protein [Acidimicrobiales bacterium]